MNFLLSKCLIFVTVFSIPWLGLSTVDAQVTKEMRSTARVYPTTQPVAGRVVDEAGWPIVGAVVVQYGKSKGYGYSEHDVPRSKFETKNRAVTDVFGKFKFESYDFDHGNETKTYFIHPKYAFRRVRSPFEVYGETVLAKGGDVVGNILSHDGKPIEGAEIGVSVPTEEITGVSYGRTKTDQDGRFVLPNAEIDGRSSMWMKIPGQHSQWLTWYADEGVDGAAKAVQKYPDRVVIGQDFEFRFRALRPVKIKVIAEDTGQPISINRVMFRHFANDTGMGFGIPNGHYEIRATRNLIQYDYLQPGINRFWLFPEDNAQYPAVFYDVRLEENFTSVADIEIKIPRGATIDGKVADQVTGKAVVDALLEFRTDQPGKLLSQGIFVRQFCRTQSDGTFSVVMPATPLKIQVVGDCGNYRSIPRGLVDKLPHTLTRTADGAWVGNTPKISIPEELEKSVDLKPGDKLDIGVFHLEKGTKATGTVVDSNGQPLANVGVLSTGNRYSRRRIPFGFTDANGRFEIGALFTNAIRDLPQSGRNDESEPTADVFFFDVDRGLSKLVTIKESESNAIRVTLADSPAAWGRVVDTLTGKPIPGVKISGNGSVNLLILGATTDKDGSYLLEHLPRDGISFSFRKDGYKHHYQKIEFLGQDQNRILLDVSDIKLLKELAYGLPDKPDVTGLTPAESINKLESHIAKELTKLPPREPSGSWSSDDSDTKFKSQLAKDVGVVMDRLLEENKDSEFQVESALRIFQALSTSQGGAMISFDPQMNRMKQILLKNLDQADVFDAYSKFRFTWSHPDDFEIALDNNQLPTVRLWATQKLLGESEHALASSAHLGFQRTGADEFQKRLRRMERAWRTGLSEFPDEDSHGMLFQARIRASMNRVVAQIERKPHDEQRLNAVKALIAELNE